MTLNKLITKITIWENNNHTRQALCMLRIRKLLLWRTLSITERSRNESGFSSGLVSSIWLMDASSALPPTFPALSWVLSRCSWSKPSTLLCKLSGITTCTNGKLKFQPSSLTKHLEITFIQTRRKSFTNHHLPLWPLIIQIRPVVR